MATPSFDVAQVTGPAFIAVLCTTFAQHQSPRQAEVSSEALCWLLLPLVFNAARWAGWGAIGRSILPNGPNHRTGTQPASSTSLWIVAVCLGISCCYKAELGAIWLLPTLTPLILMVERKLRTSSESQAPWLFSTLVNTLSGTAFVAFVAILAVSEGKFMESVISSIPVAALLVVYAALTPRTTENPQLLPRIDIEEDIVPLSSRVVVVLVVILGAQTVAFGLPSNVIMSTLQSGVVRAISWYFTIQTARHSSWRIATAMTTFGIVANPDPSMLSSELQAVSQVVASFLALCQVIYMLPHQAKARAAIWFALLLSLIPYLSNVFAIRNAKSSFPSAFGHSKQHPVEALIHRGAANFERLSQSQSKSYKDAHAEYRRRYGIEPPPGFEAWYGFAVANKSPIIDDFDTIFQAVSPFLALSGEEVSETMRDAQYVQNADLWQCTFSGDTAETRCDHPRRSFDRHIELLFNTLLGDVRGSLPNVNFLVNHLDEPRVLLPPNKGDVAAGGPFKVTDMSKQPSWDFLARFCTSEIPSGRALALGDDTVKTFGVPFVTNRTEEMDICQRFEYSNKYGLFMSAVSLKVIEGMIPVFSTGSLSMMGDVLFPSPAYIEPEFVYDEAHDVEWDRKTNNLYWAGSTTGGFAGDDKWRNFHRQRFVAWAQNLDRREHFYIRELRGAISRIKSSFLNGRLFDVSFTRIFACERRFCRDQRAFFKTKSWADRDQAFRSRLVFDLDGNGISGRYYKLLASKSVPLKQTLLREWHDERLVPWVHYVPVSQSMKELPELVFYLTSTEAGQQRAKEIAEQGRDWFSKALRDVDLAVYTYRLLLEMARLQDPKRQAIR